MKTYNKQISDPISKTKNTSKFDNESNLNSISMFSEIPNKDTSFFSTKSKGFNIVNDIKPSTKKNESYYSNISDILGTNKEQEPQFNIERKSTKNKGYFSKVNSIKSNTSNNSTIQKKLQSSSLQFNYFEEGDE